MGYSIESIKDHCSTLRNEAKICDKKRIQTSMVLTDAAVLVEDLYKELQMAKAALTLRQDKSGNSFLSALKIENDM